MAMRELVDEARLRMRDTILRRKNGWIELFVCKTDAVRLAGEKKLTPNLRVMVDDSTPGRVSMRIETTDGVGVRYRPQPNGGLLMKFGPRAITFGDAEVCVHSATVVPSRMDLVFLYEVNRGEEGGGEGRDEGGEEGGEEGREEGRPEEGGEEGGA